MVRFKLLSLFTIFALLASGCTGAGSNSTKADAGAISLTEGAKVQIDLTDIARLNIQDFSLTLRQVKDDYSSAAILTDITSLVLEQKSASHVYSITIPKAFQAVRPVLLVVDIPEINTQLIDVLFPGDIAAKPGIASTLTYNLLKYYPLKKLKQFTGSEYEGIQQLIQNRITQLDQESEHLNPATIRFPKLFRYYTNGVAFNISFLKAIRNFGVNYTFDETLPVGVVQSDTPENSLESYKYAINFKINGVAAENPPFAHANNPALLLPGGSEPAPGRRLFISEGYNVSISTQGFDLDDDFIDKDMIVQYIPRVLPDSVTSKPGFPIIPEPTPEYLTLTNLTGPQGTDIYTSDLIAYNEALDTQAYPITLPFNSSLYPKAIQVDTAARNIYYLISDGMIRVPYLWNFSYGDTNRQPVIVKDADGRINDNSLDGKKFTLNGTQVSVGFGESEVHPGTGWLTKGSHCESSKDVVYQGIDPNTGLQIIDPYQIVTSRAQGPWTCVFKVFDPDLDDDPNGAADTFQFSLRMNDNYTKVATNGSQLWPIYSGLLPARIAGLEDPTCTTSDGKTHSRCGIGVYQVSIDNSLKLAAETNTDIPYKYNLIVYDRNLAFGGLSAEHEINRTIRMPPVPARPISVTSSRNNTLNVLNTPTQDSDGKTIHLYQDTSLKELKSIAKAPTLGVIGFDDLLGTQRTAFASGPQLISEFVTQPHSITGGTVTVDPNTGGSEFYFTFNREFAWKLAGIKSDK